MVNPLTNVTDVTTLGGLGSGGNKYFGIAYADNTGNVYAAPHDSDAVLIVNVRTNATDATTLQTPMTPRLGKWAGITFVNGPPFS